MSSNPITVPAGYAPASAIGYADNSGTLSIVGSDNPLPITLWTRTPTTPLSGQTSGTTLAGPFAPLSGRQVILTLAGNWEGSVKVERSVDGGTSRHQVTAAGLGWGQYSANACEPVWCEEEDGAELYLDIAITSGTLDYRLAQ